MAHTRSIYLENYGCTSNRYDLEIMLGLLEQAGHRIVMDPSQADIVIINTCAVKEPTQNRMLHRIASLRGKPLIISGCLPKIDLKAIEHVAPDFCAVLDPQSITKISTIVEHTDSTTRDRRYFSDKPPIKPTLPKIRLNPYVEIVQIAEGCLGSCSYCCARFARGQLYSFPKELIVKNVRDAVSNGAREIWLTAQDTGAYGRDRDNSLINLLQDLKQIPGDFRIRIGMMNPNHATAMLDGLCQILPNSRFFKFLHIPVQSGSDNVLNEMRRQYQSAEYTQLVKTLRSRITDITLSTDIIVGYPTETDRDFQLTIDLIQQTNPDITNISKYGHRPGTPAAQLTPLSSATINQRSRRTSLLCQTLSLESNLRMIGKIQEISLTDRTREGKPIGRTDNYKKTILDKDMPIGTKIRIKVTKASQRHLEATPI